MAVHFDKKLEEPDEADKKEKKKRWTEPAYRAFHKVKIPFPLFPIILSEESRFDKILEIFDETLPN